MQSRKPLLNFNKIMLLKSCPYKLRSGQFLTLVLYHFIRRKLHQIVKPKSWEVSKLDLSFKRKWRKGSFPSSKAFRAKSFSRSWNYCPWSTSSRLFPSSLASSTPFPKTWASSCTSGCTWTDLLQARFLDFCAAGHNSLRNLQSSGQDRKSPKPRNRTKILFCSST